MSGEDWSTGGMIFSFTLIERKEEVPKINIMKVYER